MLITPGQFSHLVEALTIVLPAVSPADVTLKYFFRDNPKLGSRDRALIAETLYAVLRRRRLLEYLVPNGVPRRMALAALTTLQGVSLNQLAPLMKTADREWLEQLKSHAAGEIPFAVRADLPDWVIERLRAWLDDTQILALARGLQDAAPLDLRVNTFRTRREAVLAALNADGIAAHATPFSPLGVRLAQKIPLNKHVLFLSGAVEVQDEGSQLLGLLMEARRGEMVVDFCAGAGGKSLLLGAVMQSQGRVYAFDVSQKRLDNLGPRLKRSGLSNLHPVRIDSENDAKIKRLAGKIDRVLVDAPCTGFGTLRRNPDLKWRQTETGLAELNVKQTSILNAAAKLLKPGGRLVYGTCSILREENEDIVNAFLETHADFRLLSVAEILRNLTIGIADAGEFLRLAPHVHHTDGFFAAVLERAA
jgi:16S rRNA (cytosine967-C5)-methyltransferase